jgi:hypothetical protein
VRGSADEPTHALLTPKVTGLRSLPNSDLFDANRSNRDPGGGEMSSRADPSVTSVARAEG